MKKIKMATDVCSWAPVPLFTDHEERSLQHLSFINIYPMERHLRGQFIMLYLPKRALPGQMLCYVNVMSPPGGTRSVSL